MRFSVDDIPAGDKTFGHRFMAPAPFHVKRFEDYALALERAKVVIDPERRRDIILHDAKDLAFAQGEDAANDYRAGISAGRIKAKMPPVRAAVKKSAKTSKRKTKRS